MAKGYWIARVDVQNDDGYKPYALANPAIFKKFGGRFVVRAGDGPFAVLANKRGQQVVLDRAKVRASHREILDLYRIKEDRSPDLRAPAGAPDAATRAAP